MYCSFFSFFFFNDTATTEIYTLSLHDALPIASPSAFLILGDVPNNVLEGTLGLISNELLNLADVRRAFPHILETLLVGIPVRDVNDGGRALEDCLHAFGQRPDGNLLFSSDVE